MPGMKWNEHMSHMWTPVGLGSEKSHLSRGGWGQQDNNVQKGAQVAFPWFVECSLWKLAYLPMHITP